MLVYLAMIEESDDQAKFEEIYNTYRDLMYHVAYRYLRNEHDAEDAVHHAFLKIAENIKNILPPCPQTRHFVVIVIENHLKNIIKHRVRHPIVQLEDWHLSQSTAEPQLSGLLAQCIHALPEKQRDVMLLRYFEGYSLHEIANMLSISYDDAKKTSQRAKANLKKLYEEQGGKV